MRRDDDEFEEIDDDDDNIVDVEYRSGLMMASAQGLTALVEELAAVGARVELVDEHQCDVRNVFVRHSGPVACQ